MPDLPNANKAFHSMSDALTILKGRGHKPTSVATPNADSLPVLSFSGIKMDLLFSKCKTGADNAIEDLYEIIALFGVAIANGTHSLYEGHETLAKAIVEALGLLKTIRATTGTVSMRLRMKSKAARESLNKGVVREKIEPDLTKNDSWTGLADPVEDNFVAIPMLIQRVDKKYTERAAYLSISRMAAFLGAALQLSPDVEKAYKHMRISLGKMIEAATRMTGALYHRHSKVKIWGSMATTLLASYKLRGSGASARLRSDYHKALGIGHTIERLSSYKGNVDRLQLEALAPGWKGDQAKAALGTAVRDLSKSTTHLKANFPLSVQKEIILALVLHKQPKKGDESGEDKTLEQRQAIEEFISLSGYSKPSVGASLQVPFCMFPLKRMNLTSAEQCDTLRQAFAAYKDVAVSAFPQLPFIGASLLEFEDIGVLNHLLLWLNYYMLITYCYYLFFLCVYEFWIAVNGIEIDN